MFRQYRRTGSGFVWWTWRSVMPIFPRELLDCVFYLYPNEQAARDGEGFGGAGFVASMATEQGSEYLYAVTNQHVVGGGSRTIRFNTRAGDVEILATDPDDWRPHPDGTDLAVMPFGLARDHLQLAAVPSTTFIPETAMYPAQLDVPESEIGPGEDVIVLSRFITHDGRQRNQPAVRFGHIAMMPGDPIKTESGVGQRAFLAEVLSLSGASGSPVFVHRMWGTILGPQRIKDPQLLGVDFCHLRVWRKVYLADKRTPYLEPDRDEELYVEQNSGMMGVIPAWKLTELLETKELTTMRERMDEELREKAEHVALDSEAHEESEFERFEELARRVVQVPKELDDSEERGDS